MQTFIFKKNNDCCEAAMKMLESFEKPNGTLDGSFNKNSHKEKDKYLNFFIVLLIQCIYQETKENYMEVIVKIFILRRFEISCSLLPRPRKIFNTGKKNSAYLNPFYQNDMIYVIAKRVVQVDIIAEVKKLYYQREKESLS